jgi:Cu+-exporting ATPase
MTTAAALAHIAQNESTALLQQGMAHVYVSVALCALMFNTLGKIFMIVRAKKNFRFISGDSAKYSAYMPNVAEDTEARSFTKGILNDVPAPVFMRKTEFLTDYLKNSYCVDWADLICRRLVPVSAIFSIVIGIAAYFLPIYEAQIARNLCWAVTAGGALVSVLLPFSIMFLVNNPLLKASNALSKSDCVVMGFQAAQKFSNANAIVIDAGILFPAGSVKFLNAKRCQKPNAINSITIDESIVISASLAIKANSIMSSMFYDMISGDSDLLYKIENCIYEVNMGITGWMGSKRVMLGNREQMKHHGVDIPAESKERKHRPENADIVYLAVGSEAVAMFFIEVVPNPAVKQGLQELDENGIVMAVKTKDSFVTVAKLADIFELEPNRIRILPFDQHSNFDDYSRYTSRGSSEIACNGTFTSFAKALVTAKTLIRDMMVTSAVLFMSVIVAGLLGLLFVIFAASGMLSASTLIIYNVIWLTIVFILQGLRRY